MSTTQANTFTPDGLHVIDPTGKQWPTEVWHPCPSPWAATCDAPETFTKKENSWLVRPPLPPVPKVLTQEERDVSEFEKFFAERKAKHLWNVSYAEVWNAALAYARSTPTLPPKSEDELFEEWEKNPGILRSDSRIIRRGVFNSILAVIRKEGK